jgi:hypothetical protein
VHSGGLGLEVDQTAPQLGQPGLASPPAALLGAAHQVEHLVPVSSMLIKKCRYDTEPFATTQATS